MERRLNAEQVWQVLAQLFPAGLGDAALRGELAPEGWEASPLLRVFHPSVGQCYAEALAFHANLEQIVPRTRRAHPVPPPSLEETQPEYREEPVQPRAECADLLGLCLWDVFSDGHEVVTADGALVDLGSFRGAAQTIAEFRTMVPDAEDRPEGWGYLDFYLGTIWVGRRADCAPVYRLIFRRMHRLGLDWHHAHPRISLVDLSGLAEATERSDTPEWLGYDPSKAIAREQERREHELRMAELRAKLDEAYRESIEEARRNPPPRTVAAYREVYGRWPTGWPPGET